MDKERVQSYLFWDKRIMFFIWCSGWLLPEESFSFIWRGGGDGTYQGFTKDLTDPTFKNVSFTLRNCNTAFSDLLSICCVVGGNVHCKSELYKNGIRQKNQFHQDKNRKMKDFFLVFVSFLNNYKGFKYRILISQFPNK